VEVVKDTTIITEKQKVSRYEGPHAVPNLPFGQGKVEAMLV
jgi:hypothetical protein